MSHRHLSLVALLLLVAGGVALESRCPQTVRKAESPKKEAPNSGLTPGERQALYHLAEGSEIFPIDWLRALRSVRTDKPFLDNLERFGLLPDVDGPPIPGEPDRKLSVGLTLAVPRGLSIEMLGVNCAACHVGELRRGNNPPIRIDGAPNLFDVNTFYAELFESMAATVADDAKLIAFLETLKKNGSRDDITRTLILLLPVLQDKPTASASPEYLILQRLRDMVRGTRTKAEEDAARVYFKLLTSPKGTSAKLLRELLAQQETANTQRRMRLEAALKSLEADGGFGAKLRQLGPEKLALLGARFDFLRKIKDLQTVYGRLPPPGPGRVDAFINARNFLFAAEYSIPPDSPVRYPSLWGLSKRPWLHWDGNTNSVMERNVGQALGLGAVADPDSYASTLLPLNLHKLETLVKKLPPPEWPEKLFGAVDTTSDEFKKGKALYQKRCAACHERQEGGRKVDGVVVYVKVGTDMRRAQNFAKPLGSKNFADELGRVSRAIKKRSYKDNLETIRNELGEDWETKMDLPDEKIKWLTTGGYMARPLVGVWTTAPYLHNGSVPTLDDLLKPAKDRPTIFPVGHREYDPIKLGYVSTFDQVPEDQRYVMTPFDTRLPGNRNTGHEGHSYGTDLDADGRKALLTYLKMLRE